MFACFQKPFRWLPLIQNVLYTPYTYTIIILNTSCTHKCYYAVGMWLIHTLAGLYRCIISWWYYLTIIWVISFNHLFWYIQSSITKYTAHSFYSVWAVINATEIRLPLYSYTFEHNFTKTHYMDNRTSLTVRKTIHETLHDEIPTNTELNSLE